MAITYPLTIPSTGFARITLRQSTVSKLTESPFTYKQQAIVHTGQRWEASVQLPPVSDATAREWVAWLSSLRGVQGSFLMGDPVYSAPRGAAASLSALTVDGDDQTGGSLDVETTELSVTGYLLAGDYIQLGSGATTSLHMVLQDVDTDGSGKTTLDLWPDVRRATVDGEAVVLSSPKGRWRLNQNLLSWDINSASMYGISFDALEAIS